MSQNAKKFGKAKKTSGASVTVGQWVASGWIDQAGEFHGKVRHVSAFYRNNIDMQTADALIEDLPGFIRACETATGPTMEKHYRDQAARDKANGKAADPDDDDKPATVKRFGK